MKFVFMKRPLIGLSCVLLVLLCGLTKVNSEENTTKKVEGLLVEKMYPQAIGMLRKEGVGADLVQELLYTIRGDYISVTSWSVAALKANRNIIVSSGDPLQDAAMKQIEKTGRVFTSVQCYFEDVIGISEGIALVEGLSDVEKFREAERNATGLAEVVEKVATWKNVKVFDSHYPFSAIALTSNGRILYANANHEYEKKVLDIAKALKDVVAVEDGRSYVAFLKGDGTVETVTLNYFTTLDAKSWTGVVDISAGKSLIGLREDGTVLVAGYRNEEYSMVETWRDIIAISAAAYQVVGLKRDGTVVGLGNNMFHQLEFSDWSDIVAIDTQSYLTIGLKAEGTLVMVGDSKASGVSVPDISKFDDLYVPSIVGSNKRLFE